MKASKMLITTLKESPSDAKINSHILLIRAGLLKAEVAGVYNYLPMGLRVLRKIENIIREEMDKSGAQEILCSALQPKDLWVESGRWDKYGPELMRLKDRHDREFCLGPTHEEVFTSMARDLIKSSKSLPLTMYQIQTKYRDEFRPRFGLMRSREFIMKDAYSFDKDEKGLNKSYQLMYDTYSNIFTRLHLKFEPVLADTGNIGGNGSHQFMALSDIGESTIISCNHCHYAADQEKAECQIEKQDAEEKELALIDTPNVKTIDELVKFGFKQKELVKSIIYHDFYNEKYLLTLIRGDREVNIIKLVNESNSNENYLKLATDEEIASLGLIKGFIGPVNLQAKVDIYVDKEVSMMNSFISGANLPDKHYQNIKFGRDFNGQVCDLILVQENDLCPICGQPLSQNRGIEVGQIFKLQDKYSSKMNLTYLDEKGQPKNVIMGCYGIGVTRTMQAIIEQNNDEAGIIWPMNVAPYHVVIVPINYDDSDQKKVSDKLAKTLEKLGAEVILDDRNERPGFKFKDWELMGIPYIVTVGRRASENIVEFKTRSTMEKVELSLDEVKNTIKQALKEM